MDMGDNSSLNQRSMKPKVLRVVAKGFFPGWSSQQVHVDILYRPTKGTIIFVCIFGQKKLGEEDGRWYKPCFRPPEVKRLTEYARERHEEGYVRRAGHGTKHDKLKGHKKELCEKCCGSF